MWASKVSVAGKTASVDLTGNGEPVTSPEQLKGVKIRTMENDIHMEMWRAFGANPTPMAFGELYTALQQKTVDTPGESSSVNL